jgi:hypothetical protein
MESPKSFEQLKQEARDHVRVNVCERYKTKKATRYDIPMKLAFRLEDAFIAEIHPEINVLLENQRDLDEEFQRNEEQIRALSKRQQEIPILRRNLLARHSNEKEKKVNDLYRDLLSGLENERKKRQKM